MTRSFTEGIVSIDATAVFKNAPHPKLKPIDPIKPEKLYPLGADDLKDFPRYDKIWKEIFAIR